MGVPVFSPANDDDDDGVSAGVSKKAADSGGADGSKAGSRRPRGGRSDSAVDFEKPSPSGDTGGASAEREEEGSDSSPEAAAAAAELPLENDAESAAAALPAVPAAAAPAAQQDQQQQELSPPRPAAAMDAEPAAAPSSSSSGVVLGDMETYEKRPLMVRTPPSPPSFSLSAILFPFERDPHISAAVRKQMGLIFSHPVSAGVEAAASVVPDVLLVLLLDAHGAR